MNDETWNFEHETPEIGSPQPGTAMPSGFYPANCSACGAILLIVSPRIGQLPVKVWPTDFGLCLSEKIDIVRTHCPQCGKAVWVKFQYP